MARSNYTPITQPKQDVPAQAPSIEPSVVGGAEGVIDEQVTSSPSVVRASRADVPPPQKWRVVNGGHVMLDGVRVPLRVGKEVCEGQYDVPLLRRQGIKLELIEE